MQALQVISYSISCVVQSFSLNAVYLLCLNLHPPLKDGFISLNDAINGLPQSSVIRILSGLLRALLSLWAISPSGVGQHVIVLEVILYKNKLLAVKPFFFFLTVQCLLCLCVETLYLLLPLSSKLPCSSLPHLLYIHILSFNYIH